MPFKTEAPELPKDEAESLRAWTKSAPLKTQPTESERPWEAFDKHAAAKITFNLRLNEYERALLTAVARGDDRSKQKVIKRLLVAALEEAVGIR